MPDDEPVSSNPASMGESGSQQPAVQLHDLGWNPKWEELYQQFLSTSHARDAVPGRVVLEGKHGYRIVGAEGEVFAKCAPNLLRRRKLDSDLPKVGDWIVYQPATAPSPGIIQAILPRQSHLTRKVPGRQVREQILATNVNVAFIVQGLDQPFNPRRMERFLVMAHEGWVKPVVVLNKIDLMESADLERIIAEATVVAAGSDVHPVSAKSRKGIRALRQAIGDGLTAVFLGISGAGKSSLINALAGEQLQETLDVREGDSKGRHTTTSREMLLLQGGGLVIDTPGLRELHLLSSGAGLADAFPEIVDLSVQCRFRDCSHRSEPDCAVKTALTGGQLPEARYNAYLKLRQEMEQTAAQNHHSTGLKTDRDPGHRVASTRANRKRKRNA